MAKVKKLVTQAQIIHAFTRDVAKGVPEHEDDAVAYADAKHKGNWFSERLADLLIGKVGRGLYRSLVRGGHRMFGQESVEIEVEED